MESSAAEKLERLHLKLAVCDSDAQLQKFTDAYLDEVIRLAAKNVECVKQVQEILSHYNRRVKNNTEIKFPLQKLLPLMNEGPVAMNLAMVYLRFAKNRLTDEDQLALLPTYLKVMEGRAAGDLQCFDLFILQIPALIALSKLDKSKWPEFSFPPVLVPVFVRLFQCILAYSFIQKDRFDAIIRAISESDAVSAIPGFSTEEFCDFVYKVSGEVESVTDLHLAIIRLLSAEFLPMDKAFSCFVVASSSRINQVEEAADSLFKRIDVQKYVDDKDVVADLMRLYLGSPAQPQIPVNRRVPAASDPVKARILVFLAKSALAPTSYMDNVKICFDCLANADRLTVKKLSPGLTFVHKVIEKMPPAALRAFGSKFYNSITDVVNRVSSANATVLYRCLGELGKSMPTLIYDDLAFIGKLFETVAEEGEEISYAAMDCLTAWLPAICSSSDEALAKNVKQYVSDFVSHDNIRCRMVALKYAEALLKTEDFDVTWLLLSSAGDVRDEVRREAVRLLDASLRTHPPKPKAAAQNVWFHIMNDVHDEQNKEVSPVNRKFSAAVHQMCSRYLWAVCECAAGLDPQLYVVEGDDHWRVSCPRVAATMMTVPKSEMTMLSRTALLAIGESQDVHLYRIALTYEFICPSQDPGQVVATCIQKCRSSARSDLSSCSAHLAAMLVSPLQRKEALNQYVAALKENPTTGLCWLAAWAVSTSEYEAFNEDAKHLIELLMKLAEESYNRPSSLLEASFGSLAVILEAHHLANSSIAVKGETAFTLVKLCEKVAASRKDSIASKAREAAVNCLGLLDPASDVELGKSIISALYAIGEGPPQPELQLVVGPALWNFCAGRWSVARQNPYLFDEANASLCFESSSEHWLREFSAVLDEIIERKLNATNHHLRRAAIVWLLMLVQRCGTASRDFLKPRMDDLQASFADALTENDDFTQDIASKGLGLLYQIADESQRKNLVSGLMGALVEGRRGKTRVQGDTVLFKEGELGKAPDGSNLTTYKELCSLATDLNQPDLVYKFMQLAKHNAAWNAKKGAAFGFGAVLEQAKDELAPYFGQLVPKLFRYRYDPDMKVQQSMRSIWSALSSSKKNVVDEYADDIAKDLIPQLTHVEWRVRESACLALADLLQGHDTPYMATRVPELFEILMRVKDDIKESVRIAANRAAESLRKLILRMATTSNQAKADEFLTNFLPMLIEKGINTGVKATKGYSLSLLLELSKTAGRQLKPFLHTLVPILLDSISDSEHAVLNYIAARSSTTQLEALDDARAHMAGSSPMMTAVNDLLPQIDASSLTAMQPKLCDQLRASVGLSTRSAAAQLVTQLSLRAPQLMLEQRALSDKFFAALAPGIRDRNPSVRKTFANALSYLAKYVSPNQLNSLMKSVTKDLVSENEDMKLASLHVLKNFLAHCPELVQANATQLVPYVFLETCREVIKGDDASKKRHDDWNQIWEELVPSTSAAARLYGTEILDVALDSIQNNSVWAVRAQAGRMLASAVEAMGEQLETNKAVEILEKILPLLSGRIWTGKESLLAAIQSILVSSGDRLGEVWTEENKQNILAVLQREASKKNKSYSAHGLATTAAFAAYVPSTNAASFILDQATVATNLALNGDENESDEEELSNVEKEAVMCQFLSANLKALALALRAYRNGTSEATEAVRRLGAVLVNGAVFWKARQIAIEELLTTVEKWKLQSALPATGLVEDLLVTADEMCAHQRKTIAGLALQVVLRIAERRDVFSVDWDKTGEALRANRAAAETGLSGRLEEAMEVD